MKSNELNVYRSSEDFKTLKKTTDYDFKYNPELLETFENKFPDNDYVVKFLGREMTSVCPITGQPDFIDHCMIIYKPDKKLIESKSLKLYLGTFREFPAFGEDLTNTILNDLVKKIDPIWIRVMLALRSRGGLGWTTSSDYKKLKNSIIDIKGQITDQFHNW